MNYRHAFHAGNFADVMKHITVARVVEHLKKKPAPFRVIDVHAGTGLYHLDSDEAERTGEWREGVGRLYRDGTCDPAPLSASAEPLLAPWRKAIASVNDGLRLQRYPGSPEIVRLLTREQDRLALNELHPEDYAALVARYRREERAKTLQLDGWTAVKALLPPPERRGLVLIDPPYEAPGEVRRAVDALREAHRRFATGVLCLWYPVKAQADADSLARTAAALALPKTLRAELTVRRADGGDKLNGSGLILINPPFGLEAELRILLPPLAARMADASARFRGGARVEWLVEEPERAAGGRKRNAGPEGMGPAGGERPA
jgi:23S rRNA (adenine2030-N6)-methyltransferase